MKNSILAVIVLLTVTSNFAQQINGSVFDNLTKEPLVGATLLNKNTSKGTIVSHQGTYNLTYTSLTDSVEISFIGYDKKLAVISDLVQNSSIGLYAKQMELNVITITASREAAERLESPLAIHKLSAQIVDETKFTSVYELINKTPGVLMTNLNNEQHSMSIRQPMTTASYFLYMEDGVPIRPTGVFNHNALLEINQFAIGSVEVVKGPVSSIYGPEAIGGGINFFSHRPTAVPTVKVGIQFDQWGYKRVQFATGATIGKFGYHVAGLSSTQQQTWLARSDYDKHIVNGRFDYNFTSKTRLIGTLMYGQYDSQTSGSVDSLSFFSREYPSNNNFTYRKVKAMRSRLTLEHDWNSKAHTFITAFQRKNEHGQNPSYMIRWNPNSNPTTARGQINSSNFSSYGTILQHSQRFSFLKSKLIAGATYDYSPVDYWAYQIDLDAKLRPDGTSVELFTIAQERPDIPISEYNAVIQNLGLYSQYDLHPIKNMLLSIGGRFDQMLYDYNNILDASSGRNSYSQFTPKIGMTYNLKNNRGLYANYAKGFSPPSLTAVFRPKPKVNDTDPTEFYYNLQPALFNNLEVGVWAALFKNKVMLDVSVYQLNGTNELLNIRQPDNSFDYQSAGKTRHQGIEIGLTYKPSKQVFFRTGGALSIHTYEDFLISERETDAIQNLSGFEMPSAPRMRFNSELSYYPKFVKNLRTSLEWQYVSGWYQNQINTIEAEGYNLINFRIGYKWKAIELFGNIMNVANSLYATNISRGNNPTDRSNYTPAAPRTFVMGFQINF
jgi:iron complex outermembrane recepter protein